MITITDYFRELALHDLGIRANDYVIEIHDYITEKLTNVHINKYFDPDNIYHVYYLDDYNNFIFEYNVWSAQITLFYNSITKKVLQYFPNNENTDIDELLIYYITKIHNIRIHSISHTYQ